MANDTLKLVKPAYREFNARTQTGERIRLSVRMPYSQERTAGRRQFGATYNESLLAGMPTRSRMIRMLKKNGMWDSEQEEELTTLRQSLAVAQKRLREEKLSDDEKSTTIELASTFQTQIGELFSDFESMVSETADARAEVSERNFLIACVVEHAPTNADGSPNAKAGTRVWDTLDAFEDDDDTVLGQRVIYEYTACTNEQPSEWTEAEEKAEAAEKAKLAAEAEAEAAKITAEQAPVEPVVAPADPIVEVPPADAAA